MTYPVLFTAKIYDEFAETKQSIIHGITFASSFGDAASTIERDYGDDLISVNIALLEAGSTLELSQEIYDTLCADNDI